MFVIINEKTVGGTVVMDTTVCAPDNAGPLALINHVGDVLRWEFSENSQANWALLSNESAAYQFQEFDETTNFRAIVKSPGCPVEVSGVATITVQELARGWLYRS